MHSPPVATEIFVASIPNLKQLYDVNKRKRERATSRGPCSGVPVDAREPVEHQARRHRATRRGADPGRREYNNALRPLCGATAKCRFDNFAVANLAFGKADISTRDYFHPSLAGQATLARPG